MLQITISTSDLWDEKNQEFVYIKDTVLQLEHSLIAVSKWESKWHKSFLHTKDKTTEEVLDYIRCMTLTKNVDPKVYNFITKTNLEEIDEYINNPMTAVTLSNRGAGRGNQRVVTAELIYYWMITLKIPFECQKWHLGRLTALIQVCADENEPPKKMSAREIMRRNTAVNAARRKQYNTKG